MIRCKPALTFALVALCGAGSVAATETLGNVRLDGPAWKVADGIVVDGDDDAIVVAFSDVVFDQARMLADGRLDGFDLMRHEGNQIRLSLSNGVSSGCIDFVTLIGEMVKSGSHCQSDMENAVKLSAMTDTRVAGRILWVSEDGKGEVDVHFDVARVPPPASEPLAADGGEPGRALTAHFAAISAGDWEALKASAAPARRAMMEASEASGEHLKMFEFMRSVTPSQVRITGGRLEGEFAEVDYVSEDEKTPEKGSARMQRTDGRWYLVGQRRSN
jgi:hypothetical protein